MSLFAAFQNWWLKQFPKVTLEEAGVKLEQDNPVIGHMYWELLKGEVKPDQPEKSPKKPPKSTAKRKSTK